MAVRMAPPAAPTRTSLAAAAQTITTTGVGQFVNMVTTVNTNVVLPAGGTWKYAIIAYNASGAITGQAVGVAAGGSTIRAAVATDYVLGWAERIT